MAGLVLQNTEADAQALTLKQQTEEQDRACTGWMDGSYRLGQPLQQQKTHAPIRCTLVWNHLGILESCCSGWMHGSYRTDLATHCSLHLEASDGRTGQSVLCSALLCCAGICWNHPNHPCGMHHVTIMDRGCDNQTDRMS